MSKALLILFALVAIIGLPFALRPEFESDPRKATSPTQKLNIITPHNETIRYEFTQAFRRYMRDTEGQDVYIEWRSPGGTSEIEKIIDTEYSFAFKQYWTSHLKREWTDAVATAFDNRKITLPAAPADDTPEQAARRAFLDSDVGIGIDLFFGGGAYPFDVHAAKGHLVDSNVIDAHPEWFQDEVIPEELGGETFYDHEHRWIGCCLSSFGICYNSDSFARLGIPADEPITWDLLGDPRLSGEVAMADPAMSGTITKAFEMILQQKMRQSIDEHSHAVDSVAGQDPVTRGLDAGWAEGMRLIQKIGGNARYFANYSPKVPGDVASGNAAAGMTIDYYGRTYNEKLRDAAGHSRAHFITPLGGSATSVDPIALFRGAPNQALARKFITFLLSEPGQKLWNYRPGTPGGPEKFALRRLPVRKDLYDEEHQEFASDPGVLPFELAKHFRYEASWTAPLFSAIRFLIKAACVDTHPELRDAWKALIDHGFPPEATARFHDITPILYARAGGIITETLRKSAREQSLYALELSTYFRDNYLEAKRLATLNR